MQEVSFFVVVVVKVLTEVTAGRRLARRLPRRDKREHKTVSVQEENENRVSRRYATPCRHARVKSLRRERMADETAWRIQAPLISARTNTARLGQRTLRECDITKANTDSSAFLFQYNRSQ